MIREIIDTADSSITLELPIEMIGKRVEVIAFEINRDEKKDLTKPERLKRIKELTKTSKTDLSWFKFDRDEANNYDE